MSLAARAFVASSNHPYQARVETAVAYARAALGVDVDLDAVLSRERAIAESGWMGYPDAIYHVARLATEAGERP